MNHITQSDNTSSPEIAAGRRWYIRVVILVMVLLSLCSIIFTITSGIYLRVTEKHTIETILLHNVTVSADSLEKSLAQDGITDIQQLENSNDSGMPELFAGAPPAVKFAMLVDTSGRVIQNADPMQAGSMKDIAGSFERAFHGESCVEHFDVIVGGEKTDVINVTVPFKLDGVIRGALRMGFSKAVIKPLFYREKAGKGIRRIGALFIALIVVVFLVYSIYIYQVFERHYAALVHERDRLAKQQIELIGTGIVHEIKNSLNGIRMNAQLLQDSLDSLSEAQRKKLQRKVERIQNEAARTGTVLSEFLTYAKPAEFSPAYMNVAALVDDLAQFFEPECRQRNITISQSCSEGLTNVYADEQLLRHGISNLLWNAIQAVDADGEIRLNGKRIQDKARISVSDTGGGMDVEIARKAFDVFFSTKPKGIGLGLSIVQRVAAMHQGTVQIDNQPGTGCTIAIQFSIQES